MLNDNYDYDTNICWMKINECVLSCGKVHDYFTFGMTALNELEKLVPFEKGIVYFMDGNQKPIDYYTIRGMKEDINEYLNYYLKTFDNKHEFFKRKKNGDESRIVVVDWNDFEPSAFIKEYVYPQKIRWMLQFMISDHIGIPRIAFSVTRNNNPFSESEIEVVKIFAEHLENLHINFFVNIQYAYSNNTDNFHNWRLTEREKEIAELICRGVSTDNIASRLNITKQTVYRHVANVYKKMNVTTKQELLLKMIR